MKRWLRTRTTMIWLLGLSALALPGASLGCMDKLPMAPSNVTRGIAIYEHAGFQGQSAAVESDVSDLRNVTGPCEYESSSHVNGRIVTTTIRNWNDCMSSIRVAPGWRAVLYRGTGFDGDSLEVTADVQNLQVVQGGCSRGLNDCISSIRVRQQ